MDHAVLPLGLSATTAASPPGPGTSGELSEWAPAPKCWAGRAAQHARCRGSLQHRGERLSPVSPVLGRALSLDKAICRKDLKGF